MVLRVWANLYVGVGQNGCKRYVCDINAEKIVIEVEGALLTGGVKGMVLNVAERDEVVNGEIVYELINRRKL